MRKVGYIALFLLAAALLFYPRQKEKEGAPYNAEVEQKKRSARYHGSYEELSWLNDAKQQEVVARLQFIESAFSGTYIDFLQLLHEKGGWMTHESFCLLHKKLMVFAGLSHFSPKELQDMISYSALLSEIEKTNEYKQRAWMYEASLAKILLMHDHILPTMARLSGEQKKFFCLLLEGLQFEGFIDLYRESIAYNVEEDFAFLSENKECFDLSFFCRLYREANKYAKAEATLPQPCD
ncbi:hypothetical protein K0U07_05440 [bacterium]|nr:hypothetical protein [bacterium]